jgi:CRP/FNR family transcriptional regulator
VPAFCWPADRRTRNHRRCRYPEATRQRGLSFHEGAPSEGFYVVQRGAINVHRVSATGKEQVIHVFRAGQSFAEAALASEGGYPADARAIENSTVLLIPKTDFVGLLRSRPELALRMLGSMSQHLRVLVGPDRRSHAEGHRKPPRQLAPQALPASAARGAGDNPTRPHQSRVLAAELGTVSETFSRTLAKLRKDQLVRVSEKPSPSSTLKSSTNCSAAISVRCKAVGCAL